MRSRPISVVSRPLTEIGQDSAVDMEISPRKASELLRVTDSRVRQLLRSGELPGRKVGPRWLVKRSAVLAYVMPRRVAA
jgi:excisionase family DNA binding protein